MEQYIQISKLNDFIFCPYSLYLHTIYENFDKLYYYSAAQTRGLSGHEAIDKKSYSSSKDIFQGISVYSETLNLMGKIDIFNNTTKTLIERKYKIKNIYLGYKLQLYAQFFCLKETGFDVKKIVLYSLSDNKKYSLPLPTENDFQTIKKYLKKMINFNSLEKVNKNKCNNCIYEPLCNMRGNYDLKK